MSDVLIVIPARYASTRLPGKPLLAETGKPMIVHTAEVAASLPDVRVVVATDDERICTAVEAAGFAAVMTAPHHRSGTDRVAEVARDDPADIVLNLQGDEPEIEAATIDTLIDTHRRAMAQGEIFASTLASPMPVGADPHSPDLVKATLTVPDAHGLRTALTFSRAAVPFVRTAPPQAQPLLHLGLYAFSAQSLQIFPTLTPTPLEQTESLEQLRILEHGHRIAVGLVDHHAPGIDTPADYAAFVARHAQRSPSVAQGSGSSER
ncbi:3-deoxy-D-manno-octulosonate cytidylyltransferase [Parvularcula bermudensis HTCC2503]|uniref:3-deoxy-D-manno-octulosonate cytidylyltransferase n=1 Tax=Parvularcula bermudensis (strain ATCC BAA-594 / HTCC2503 / KCTC 12087) TaxID=314260 RepID=E0TGI7_PARBH|nr:3-deoxy-manno-octulosonate cytidylyltransferase [Parvularcula bermudensis]ADM09606.1 3-deoxy-D-manno-octulosonate cytidylyltransferase [Parvularcula bermudensis HTCC2503]